MSHIMLANKVWWRSTAVLIGLSICIAVSAADRQVNINTAQKSELMSLEGISRAEAEAIIRHREKFGGFKSVYGLINVKGVGADTVDAVLGHVTVGKE